MTEESEVDYKALYEKVKAENDALTTSLTEHVDKVNNLEAKIKVIQLTNRKTVGTSEDAPESGIIKKVSLSDAIAKYRNKNKK